MKTIRRTVVTLSAVWALTTLASSASAEPIRPPAVPLVACDPYFSIWSPADILTDASTVHWTGKPHRLSSMVQIDGQPFRLMGVDPVDVTPLPQKSVLVLPTRTIYTFEGSGIRLTLTWLTPALPDDLDLLARPVTYVTWECVATDGQSHQVKIDFAARGELAVNTPDQQVEAQIEEHGELTAAKVGSVEQPVLVKPGDDIRIDWGYLYVAVPKSAVPKNAVPKSEGAQVSITPAADKLPAAGQDVTAAVSFDLGSVSDASVSRWLILAYDDLYSIQYMKKNLRPYWRRTGWEASDLLKASADEYQTLHDRCADFDRELMTDLAEAGGENYAALCALAYRQCFAAGKFVADDHGQPLQFCKENHSNGCIGTSDVFYPMAPQFLLLGPTLSKSFLVPFMNYAASERWKFPFAPHDLGQYPHANGQRYGGGERTDENQMPVEESGNLLILMAAIAQMEGNADFAGLYWPQLKQWAEYLKDKGFDPDNQLCTDDFAGHLAHNVNLSAKAICGLGAFGKLCAMRGDPEGAREYTALARQFAQQWVQAAREGDHFRLAFDRPKTWSQKYNLVWDRILGLNLFPEEVKRTEMDYYRQIQDVYGLPLDNRQTYTKLDWILWTATLTQNRDDFEALVNPVVKFLNETPDRVPMTDWYFTDSGRRQGFTARPVVGGVFLQMLYDPQVWAKYAGREKTKGSNWAPMPTPPRTEPLVPTSQQQPATWRYTLTAPQGNWQAADYDDSPWHEGPGGFGAAGTPGAVIGTPWNSNDIWLRRTVELNDNLPDRLALRVHHDEDVEVYINGTRVFRRRGYTTDYESNEISKGALQSGRNVIAVHCHQTTGGQFIDVGIDAIIPADADKK